MSEIHIVGWRPGLEKIGMTRLLREQAGLRLKEAKDCTDRVLEGETIVLPMSDASQAEKLANELNHIGAIVELRKQ